MAKNKFFYNRIYNTKRNIINAIIIAASVIGIIICFILTSKFYGSNPNEPKGEIDIKNEVTVEINEKFSKDIFFARLENINIDDIDIKYPENYNISIPGRYDIIINISDKNYNSTLIVVDTEKPDLVVKNVTINENEQYTANDFITSCSDNSNKNCNISFYNDAVDEDGNKIYYNRFHQSGSYNIKISAKDESGNEIVKDAILTIKAKNNTTIVTPTPTTQDCKYGNSEYDTENYLLAISIVNNNCAISLDLYKDSTMVEKINKLMETETVRIKKDVDVLKLNGRFALNRQINAVLNKEGTGLVGYELTMSVNITENGKSRNVVSYKVNSDGKRVFTNNPYNLNN